MSRGYTFYATRYRVLLAVGVGWFLAVPAAQAHTTFPGSGEFVSGFLHPLTTPAHILALLALGLWLGQRLPLRLAWPAKALAGGVACGLLASWGFQVAFLPAPLPVGIGLLAAAVVVAARPLPIWVQAGSCGLAGMVLGLDSGVDPGTPGLTAAKMLLATGVSLVLTVVNVAFYTSLLPPRQWTKIAVRVAASWIVAIGLLLLAFALRR